MIFINVYNLPEIKTPFHWTILTQTEKKDHAIYCVFILFNDLKI